MSSKNSSIKFFKALKPHFFRFIYILFFISFFFPYITVKGCSSKEITVYYGYDLLQLNYGLFYGVAMGIFLLYFIVSVVKMRKEVSPSLSAFAYAWRAMSASLCALIVWYLPRMQFILDGVYSKAGQVIGIFCSLAVFADSLIMSVTGAFGLRRGSSTGVKGLEYSRPLYALNSAVIALSVIAIPFYFIENINEIYTAFIILILLTLPFILSQYIVLQGLKRSEKWPTRWSLFIAVSSLIVIIIALYNSVTIY